MKKITLALAAFLLVLTAAQAEPSRPETARFVMAYDSQTGPARVATLRVGPREKNEALVQIAGIDHPWDRKVFKASVTQRERGLHYSITHNGQPYVLFIETDGQGEAFLPEQRSIKVQYSKALSEQSRPEPFLTDYLQQK